MKPSNSETLMVETRDFERLETKVDDLTSAVRGLILIEERQRTQRTDIDNLWIAAHNNEKNISTLEKKFDRYVNIALGMWIFVLVAWELYQLFYKGNH